MNLSAIYGLQNPRDIIADSRSEGETKLVLLGYLGSLRMKGTSSPTLLLRVSKLIRHSVDACALTLINYLHHRFINYLTVRDHGQNFAVAHIDLEVFST